MTDDAAPPLAPRAGRPSASAVGPKRDHFRGKSRPGRQLAVRYCLATDENSASAWIGAETRNIGVGGAFVSTAAPPPVGTAIVLEVRDPKTQKVFALHGIVRWSPAATSTQSGMGVQFTNIATMEIEALLELNEYFASLSAVNIDVEL